MNHISGTDCISLSDSSDKHFGILPVRNWLAGRRADSQSVARWGEVQKARTHFCRLVLLPLSNTDIGCDMYRGQVA